MHTPYIHIYANAINKWSLRLLVYEFWTLPFEEFYGTGYKGGSFNLPIMRDAFWLLFSTLFSPVLNGCNSAVVKFYIRVVNPNACTFGFHNVHTSRLPPITFLHNVWKNSWAIRDVQDVFDSQYACKLNVCTCLYAFAWAYMDACACACMCAHVYVCVCSSVCVCVCAWAKACMLLSVWACLQGKIPHTCSRSIMIFKDSVMGGPPSSSITGSNPLGTCKPPTCQCMWTNWWRCL
jgi:hypothetical protein